MRERWWGRGGLHVETLRRALVLPVEHVLLGLLEVLVVHLNKRVTLNSLFSSSILIYNLWPFMLRTKFFSKNKIYICQRLMF